ncbi:potassium transporter TrkH [Ligilactobacillus salitolerans]|uniref:Potassium transporter TrkH n=1 Tax=Ligilactobacillus salitolerans TaxID=1808352 RepID=A0A401IQH0_9LACO|nr:TrkH family potassium uptake protein [Ligilactobacillus salitolerans]GBG93789.1 potassium transporter TrkH [Ligilactobacillus salitolerans]
MFTFANRHFTLSSSLTIGFVAVILIGAALLTLPIATVDGVESSFITALFTSTSATCVTGLTLVHTATYWSFFGQFVIMMLSEIGGLGFMTFMVLMFTTARRKLRLSTQLLAQESLNLQHLSQIRLVKLIVNLSLGIQGLGALLLFFDFYPKYGWLKGLWYSVFHSVSAFCNAGFSLFDNSISDFQNNTYVLTVLGLLILSGSVGFLVWRDLLTYPKRHHLSLHTKLSLRTGAVITTLSIILYWFTESGFANITPGASTFHKVVNTIFMGVTPRTAGLTTFDYTNLSLAGIFLTMLLMFIGGTPGSTAGGIKSTTIGLLAIQTWATLRGQHDVVFSNRRFPRENIYRALTLVVVGLTIVAAATFFLCMTQPLTKKMGLEYIIFEVLAAFGTTGISLGLTEHLTLLGKIIIMLMMFIGRVGIFNVMYTVLNAHSHQADIRYPEESVLIG